MAASPVLAARLYGGVGLAYGEISDLTSQARNWVENEKGINTLSINLGEKLSDNISGDILLAVSDFDRLTVTTLGIGARFYGTHYPKTTFAPWAGLYLTFHDLTGWPEQEFIGGEPNPDLNGLGMGYALAAGLSLKLSRDVGLQLRLSRNFIGAIGLISTFDGFDDTFEITNISLSLQFYEEGEILEGDIEGW